MGVSASTPIGYGETITGTIISPGQTDSYTFTATAGDTIYARLHTNWQNGPQIRLYAPNGATIVISTYNVDPWTADLTQTLPSTGSYTLLAEDNNGDATGTYGLYLQRTNAPGHAVSIAFGETKTDSITKPVQMNNYSFSAAGGDTIYTRLHTNWQNGPQIRLYAPNGTMIAIPTYNVDPWTADRTLTLTSTGSYTLLVGDNTGDNTGTYGLSLQYLGSRAPVTDFSANKTSGIVPLTVKFTDATTESPYAWNWSFGDGKYSDEQNPVHTYTSTGTFTVTLNATNVYNSDIITKPNYITVIPSIPVVKFSVNDTSGYAPLGVSFTDTSTGSPTMWNWSFGDASWFNTTSPTKKSPSHLYSTPGVYTAKLIACNAGGCNTTGPTKTITVNLRVPPKVAFTVNDTSGYAPLGVKFTDTSTGSPTMWNWSFGDASWFNTTSSTKKSPSHLYSTPGVYTAKLIACNAAGCNTTAPTRTITAS
jgi:PKD repeat protein